MMSKVVVSNDSLSIFRVSVINDDSSVDFYVPCTDFVSFAHCALKQPGNSVCIHGVCGLEDLSECLKDEKL